MPAKYGPDGIDRGEFVSGIFHLPVLGLIFVNNFVENGHMDDKIAYLSDQTSKPRNFSVAPINHDSVLRM